MFKTFVSLLSGHASYLCIKALLAMNATRKYLPPNKDFYCPQALLINYSSGTKSCVRNYEILLAKPHKYPIPVVILPLKHDTL